MDEDEFNPIVKEGLSNYMMERKDMKALVRVLKEIQKSRLTGLSAAVSELINALEEPHVTNILLNVQVSYGTQLQNREVYDNNRWIVFKQAAKTLADIDQDEARKCLGGIQTRSVERMEGLRKRDAYYGWYASIEKASRKALKRMR